MAPAGVTKEPPNTTMDQSPLQSTIRELESLGRRARGLILLRRTMGVVAATVGGAAVAIVLDFIFRFPAPLRALVLAAGVAALAILAVRLISAAWRFRPTPMDLALRIERSSPSLRGRLASGIEFAQSGADRESPLAARSVADAAARLGSESLGDWLAPRRSLAELSTAVASIALVVAVSLLVPAYAMIGAKRLVLPFGDHRWPARTAVESLIGEKRYHARGSALLLAARLSEGDGVKERVVAEVVVERENGARDREELVLTRQADGRYERVLEADPSIRSASIRFRSADAETDVQAIEFVPPPAIAAARLRLEPPEYALDTLEAREVDLGDGTDGRAHPKEPVLEGSQATIDLVLAAPLAAPIDEGALAAWRDRMVAIDGAEASLEVDAADASRWRLAWRVAGPAEFRFTLEDDLGIRASDEARFRIDATRDRAPSVAVLEPAVDESVLPTAIVPMGFEARDDVGVVRAGLVVQRRPAGASEAGVVRDEVVERSGNLVRDGSGLELAAIGAQPGDLVLIAASAEDGFRGAAGERHEPAISATRTLRVIDEIELGRQIRGQLASVRRASIRVDQQQAELAAAAENGRFDPALERGQAQVSERLRAASAAVRELDQRLRRNRLDDEQLAATLAQAEDLLDAAAAASATASESMQARRERSDATEVAEAEVAARQAQEEVRAELEDLIRLLDRDEDSWAMARQIDRLREEVAELARRTEAVGRRTVGQREDQLAPADREELERIAAEQQEAARSAANLVDELRARAESVERQDRPRADAMREAARVAEERRLERNLEQGAQDVQENRLQQGQQAQQAAAEALDRMRGELENVRKARTETLRRALESLEQSIERLVRQAEDELIALARITDPTDSDAFAERGRAMAKLAQNTQAVAGEARAAGPEAGRIGRVLDRAADAQGSAVPHLRARPAKVAEATAAEERGLALLREALEAAKSAREEVERQENERKRRELMAAYRKLLERQGSIRAATAAARPANADARLDRRGIIESRRLSILQGELGRDVGGLAGEHPELGESEIFADANELIEEWASDASRRLGDGDLASGTTDLQDDILDSIATILSSLDTPEDTDPFQDDRGEGEGQSGGSSSGEGQEQLLSAVAELKVLRGMQRQVLDRTKRLDASIAGPATSPRIDEARSSLVRTQERIVELTERLMRKMERPALPAGDPGGEAPRPEPTPQFEHSPIGALR